MGLAVKATQHDAEPQGGHGRNTTSSERPDAQPRVPVIGLDAGCIPGTKPGCSARELERAGRDIVRSRMALARQKLKQGSSRPR